MKQFLLSIAILLSVHIQAQEYFQQNVRYNISAELNDKDKTILGSEAIVYKNNSATTLPFIWFHLWANAYKNNSTALMQQLKNDPSRSKKMQDATTGYIEGLNFTSGNQLLKTEPHPDNIDILKVVLNEPLKPGDSVTISTPFKVKLPKYFSRSGYADGEFMACQWYPKPAVFDLEGWHPIPYLDMGEFYSEIADYGVSITVPSDYIVAATGTLQTASELQVYKAAGSKNASFKTDKPVLYTSDKSGTKTLRYQASMVPDFAWFADKDFVILYDTIQVNGNTIDAFSFYHNKKKSIWTSSMDFIKDGVRNYSNWIGGYAYPVVQVVEGPKNNSSGGMEYPMVTLITSPDAEAESLDAVIVHEVGHNWFMGVLATNERAHTWMDEGLNTYYQFRYEAEKYRSNSIFGKAIPEQIKKMPADQFLQTVYRVMEQSVPMPAAMEVSAEKYTSSDEYAMASYIKPALWMYILETSVGREKVDAAMQNYFNKWKFKHPSPKDMQAAFEESIGGKLDSFFNLTTKAGKFE